MVSEANRICAQATDAVHCIHRILRDQGKALVDGTLDLLARHHGSYGVLARSWPTGSMVIWVAVMLGLSLALYYT